ncbi:cupin domain-containing protein [Glaciihabitans sp. dw_435]|uniref:cupin domain-containing protein n=1 Tax=Glaciihabitans sp. dw_435 TaxID=2720081 RepID=UPI001BD5AEDA|nr:cupin domain-containing protein [Glaciihabitans sp. dw_435]
MTESPVSRVILSDHSLPAALAVSHVEVRRITIAPSTALGAHTHNGPVFGTIEQGSVVFQVADDPEVTLHAGDTFYEPSATTITKFDATDEGVTFLGYFLLEADTQPELVFVS